MADPEQGNGEAPEEGHNSEALGETLTNTAQVQRECDAAIAEFDKKIDKLKAQQKPHRDRKRKAKALVKGEGIDLKYFDAIYELGELGPEHREQAIEQIRTCAAALGVGEQASFFPTDTFQEDKPRAE